MRTRTIVAIIAVIIIVIAIVGAAFVLTLQAPQVQGVSVSSIDNVSRSGFTLTFVIKLYNPNVVGVNIKSLTVQPRIDLQQPGLEHRLGDGNPSPGARERRDPNTVYYLLRRCTQHCGASSLGKKLDDECKRGRHRASPRNRR